MSSAVVALACSAPVSTSEGEGSDSAGGKASTTGGSSSAEGGGFDIDLEASPGDAVPGPEGGPGEACAAASAESEALPATLLVALDRSHSMSSDIGDTTLWNLATESLNAFFGDPSSIGLSASLQIFPDLSSVQSQQETYCPSEFYDVPDVPLTQLPNAAPFTAAFDGTGPYGLTPTHGVLTGLIRQGDALLAAAPENKVAIVLVNDGDPRGCTGTSIGDVNELVAAAADRIPTYVIGLGAELEALNGIAEAGGTGTAVLVDVTDPAAARLEVLERLNAIRNEVGGCDAVIPAPPDGQTLDPFKVSTLLKDLKGKRTPVSYEADCATGAGWHYDDLDSPTLISLCEQACESLTVSGSSLEVVFGCEVNPEMVVK